MRMNKTRVPMLERSVKERIKDFREVPRGYTKKQAIEEAKRCLQCENPVCVGKCPLNIDIKGFIKELSKGNLEDAFLKIKEENPIPAITGRVCPQEKQCEGACILRKVGDPINIGKLAAFLADWARENSIKEEFRIEKEKKQKVAIIGSGPTSITCGIDLRKKGYDVIIYEALHKAGGALQYGIPEFRLPKDIVDYELSYLENIGIKIKLNRIVGKNMSFEELCDEHDAIFIGTGAGAPIFLNVEGEDFNGVYSANEFLIRINLMKAYKFPEYDTPIKIGKKVGVIGAGDVAIDAARSALRLGADVYILYRKTKEHSPAREEELQHAIEEGVNFKELVSPKRITGKNGWIKGIELLKTKFETSDKSVKLKLEEIPGTEFIIEFDTLIVAVGTKPNRLFLSRTPKIKKGRKGVILVDRNLRTNIEGIYAGGDAISGGANVIQALGEGKRAAASIHNYLSNNCE